MSKKIKFRIFVTFFIFQTVVYNVLSQNTYYLRPSRVFDGQKMFEKYGVLVNGNKIVKFGSQAQIEANLPDSVKIFDLKDCTLMPGLIEGHSHLLLHPYNETSWDDQVLKESKGLRIIRATVNAQKTLMAGFTTVRDLGTEGADYADIDLKMAINQGICVGPRMIVATKGIVATGTYGPKSMNPDIKLPQAAEEAEGNEELTKVVRSQIAKGADLIKVYADYRWGKNAEALPTFSLEELKTIETTAASGGRPVVAHAGTAEGMRRSILAGIETIEHGDNGTPEIWKMMKEHDVCLCPTLAAGEALAQYKGWRKNIDKDTDRIKNKKASFKEALNTGVKICFGGDAGVFAHGDNAREMELMVEYGMKPLEVLQSTTSINAKAFHIDTNLGMIKEGFLADILVVNGNPTENISVIRKVEMVIKDGIIVRK